MHPASLGAAIVLGIVALSSYAYAGFMVLQGQGDDAIPLLVSATATLSMIFVLGAVGRKKKE